MSQHQHPTNGYKLILSGRLESVNRTAGQHWSKRNRTMKRIAEQAFYEAYQLPDDQRPPEPLSHALIRLTSYRKRKCDPDNLIAGAKPYIDALMPSRTQQITRGKRKGQIRSKPGIGWIVDDSAAHVQLEIDQQISQLERVVIVVIPLDQRNTDTRRAKDSQRDSD